MAVVALAIVVTAIVISKRRSISLSGSGSDDGAAIDGARGPGGGQQALTEPGAPAGTPAEQASPTAS